MRCYISGIRKRCYDAKLENVAIPSSWERRRYKLWREKTLQSTADTCVGLI